MQFTGDLLALDVLQRNHPFGELLLVRDGIAQRPGQVIQFLADRGDFCRAGRRDAGVVAARLDA